MFKRNLALLITFTLLLTGCGGANQDKANKEESIQSNAAVDKSEANVDNNEKQNSSNKSEIEIKPKPDTKVEPDKKKETIVAAGVNPKQEVSPPIVVSDTSSLSTKAINWSWLYSSRDSANLLAKYKGYGFGDTSKKVIYLTFDEGYENGYTASILDTLKANNVHAAFFVTKPYVTGSFNGVPDSELIKRMINDGHIIGNHSVQHKSMPTFTNEKAFDAELTGVEEAVNNIPGCKMSKYFRPPEGTFSELSLYYTQKLGYKSIFFALAYQDYNVDNQPDPESAKATLLKNTRSGMICLLHAVSKTNASILDSMIKEWKREGYEFKTLDELTN